MSNYWKRAMREDQTREAIRRALECSDLDGEQLEQAIERVVIAFSENRTELTAAELNDIAAKVVSRLPSTPSATTQRLENFVIGIVASLSANNLVDLFSYIYGFLGLGMSLDGNVPREEDERVIRAQICKTLDWDYLKEIEDSAQDIYLDYFREFEAVELEKIRHSDELKELLANSGRGEDDEFWSSVMFSEALVAVVKRKRKGIVERFDSS